MADQIAQTTQKLTTASEMREITSMLMQPNANWEEYLTPAPLSIAILGELVFITSGNDFSINKNPPSGGFKYIKYPESFRACLMQICNSGWQAFNEAHKNMDQIRIHTSAIPDYMRTVITTLFNASDAVINTVLPGQLDTIRSVADDCVSLADSVEKKFTGVIGLIQELLEASVNAQSFYGEELEKVKRMLEESKMRAETAKKLKEQSQKAMDSLGKQVEDAQNAYKEAMDSLPSGWEMIGMDFVEGITSSVTAILNGYTSLMTGGGGAGGSGGTADGSSTDKGSEEKNVDEIAQMKVFSKSEEILKLATTFKQYITDSGIDWKNLYDQKNKRTKTQWTKSQFQRIVAELAKIPQDPLCKEALTLCTKSINVCDELATYSPEKKFDEKKTKKVMQDSKNLNDAALSFDCKSKKALGSPALTPKPPMKFKTEAGSDEKSASQKASDNARFRIEQTREQLSQTREMYERSVKNMEKNEKELTEILVTMQKCKLDEIDFDTAIKMLVKGLDAMGRVKEQWEKMVRFFQMVSSIIKTSLNIKLQSFVKTSDSVKLLAYNDKLFTKDILYNQAFQASNIASLVHMISQTYAEVSSKYLMDRVSSLGKLMAMDKSKPEFLTERVKLQESCQEAQAGILHLVVKNKKEFELKTEARMAKIESGLKAVLPAATPEETQKIQKIVKNGFGDGDMSDYF